jgi:hypothetical protein
MSNLERKPTVEDWRKSIAWAKERGLIKEPATQPPEHTHGWHKRRRMERQPIEVKGDSMHAELYPVDEIKDRLLNPNESRST